MFKLKSLPFFSQAFTLYILFAVPALIAAPSKEVTDRLIAELQDIRMNLAQEALEIFENKAPDMPNSSNQLWQKGELCRTISRAIVNEDKPATLLDLLVGDIERIAKNLNAIHEHIDYTSSEIAERILRLHLYYSRFAHSAIPYIEACEMKYHYLIRKFNYQLHENAAEERHFIDRHRRIANDGNLRQVQELLDRTMYKFSDLTCNLPNKPIPARQAPAPATESRKRTILDDSNDSDADDTVTKNPKRTHIDEDNDNDDDDDVVEVAQPISKKPGLLSLLRSHAHDSNTIRKRSEIMAHDGLRNHLLKKESQAIAHTMIEEAKNLTSLNRMPTATNLAEGMSLTLKQACSRGLNTFLNASLNEEITHNDPFKLAIAYKISQFASDLEATHINPYAQNIARIKDWQQHYQNVLNMGCLYLKGITVKESDHIALYDRLKNRFANDLGVDVIPTLPPENPESTDIQKILDLQRITLANKTTHALANLKKMQNMLDAE